MKIEMTINEKKVFDLINVGKTRNQVFIESKISASMFPVILTKVFDRVKDVVKFRSSSNKFQELQCFLRNNPDEIEVVLSDKKKTNKNNAPLANKTTVNSQPPVKTYFEKDKQDAVEPNNPAPPLKEVKTAENKVVEFKLKNNDYSGFKNELLQFITQLEDKAILQQERAAAKIEVCADIIGWINKVEKAGE